MREYIIICLETQFGKTTLEIKTYLRIILKLKFEKKKAVNEKRKLNCIL
jgi:hypothetical protein